MDPIPRLEAVIEAIRSLPNAPDAVLVSGDLTDDGRRRGTRSPGDAGAARGAAPRPPRQPRRPRPLREAFDLPGRGRSRSTTRSRWASCGSSLLDSNRPRAGPGRLSTPSVSRWLDAELAAEPERTDAARAAPHAARHRNPRMGRDQPRCRASARRWPRSSPAIRSCGRSSAAICTASPPPPLPAARSSPRPAPTCRSAPTSRRDEFRVVDPPGSRSTPCATASSTRRSRVPSCRFSAPGALSTAGSAPGARGRSARPPRPRRPRSRSA